MTAADQYRNLRSAAWLFVDYLNQQADECRLQQEQLCDSGKIGLGAVLQGNRAVCLEWRASQLADLLEDFPPDPVEDDEEV